MARQVLTVAGFAAGFFLPGGPAVWGAIGAAIGGAVDPQVIKGPKLGEAGLQTSAEGVFRPIVFGTGAVKGNVIWRGNRQVRTRRTSQGKGSGPVSEEQRVYWSFFIRIGEPVAGLRRIWQDEKLVYDVTPESTIVAESAEFATRFRFYDGGEDQLPDPDIEAVLGVGNAPAYRGTSGVMFPNFDTTDYREMIPQFRFEVSNVASDLHSYLSLLHLDAAEPPVDETPTNTWTGGDFVTADKKFGAGSYYISSGGVGEGGAQPLSCATDFATIIGTQDFCFAGWIKRETHPGKNADTILGHWYAPGTRSLAWQIWRSGGGDTMFCRLSADGSAITTTITSDDVVPYDEWIYVALTRQSGTVRMFMNGELIGSGSFPYALHSNAGITPGANWRIGGFDAVNIEDALRGWVDEFVMILGDPVYTANFTPPTEPWPNPSSSVDAGQIELGEIVTALHQRAGQTSSDFEVSELTDMVDGLVLAGDYTDADAIRTLMPIYAFDASEYDGGDGYRIHYPKRGKPVVGVVTDDDLIDAPEKTVREDALELPRVMHLHYENPDVGYVPAKATVRRDSPDVRVVSERSIQVPVSFRDVNKPARVISRIMKIAYVERGGEEEFTVHDGLLEYVPGDCIAVSLRGQTRRMRIGQDQISPGEIKWRLIPDRQSAYTSNVTGVPVPAPTPPLPSSVGQTVYEFMDIPALNDGQDRLLWIEAASGQSPGWYGAQTQRKAGAAVEFEDSARFSQNTIMGILLDAIPAASEHYTDTTNVVRVQLYTDDTIDSLTDTQFLSELGSFALKNADGSWELLQYRDAEDEGDGIFALSHLMRGRLNTGGSAHAIGARFVKLDSVAAVDAGSAWLNTSIVTRAVSLGTSPDGVPQYTNPFVGRSQIEFPVAYLYGSIAGSTLSLRTIPRHRFGTEVNPVQSVNHAGYRWTITDGTNTATADTASASPTHSFDVTGWSTPITATVAQLNRVTGAGPTVSEQIS